MQHLAAASSRARYARRRERQRSSGLGPSHVFVFSNHENVPGFQQTYPISPEDSPTSQRPSVIQSPPSFICSTAANSDIPYKPRYATKAKSYSLMWMHFKCYFILVHTQEVDICSNSWMQNEYFAKSYCLVLVTWNVVCSII